MNWAEGIALLAALVIVAALVWTSHLARELADKDREDQ